MSAIVAGTAAPAPSAARRPRGGLLRAILHNRKAMLGAALLLLFVLLAAFPQLFVPGLHGDPRAIGDTPQAHPSADHRLEWRCIELPAYCSSSFAMKVTANPWPIAISLAACL